MQGATVARLLWAAAFLGLTCAPSSAGGEEAAKSARHNDALLQSVIVRNDAVFASCLKGLYRASTTDRKWVELKVPGQMPLGGFFADSASTNFAIYYYTPRWTRRHVPAASVKAFGLYRGDASGGQWELLSTKYDFHDLYVHDEKTVYGIVETAGKHGLQTYIRRRILVSGDSGKQWRDITHDIAPGFELLDILPDPDHKDLVCLHANRGRAYVLQAADESYRWRAADACDWHAKRSPAGTFFADEYFTGTTLFMHHATLANYFDYPFGGRTELHSFQVAVKGEREFNPKQTVVLPVEVTFLCEGESATLLDTDHGHACWGLRRILPDGTRHEVAIARGLKRNSPEVISHCLAHRQSYGRSLDLSAMADFSRSGTYRVQLVYADGWLADRRKGDWVGEFRSPVFEIKVSP